ncbi:MAG: carboxypeptidase M32, partial [Chitinophagaceae bacterium]
MTVENLYQEYKKNLQKIADVRYASAVLQWDQETYIPSKGGEIRGRQIATLSEIAHEQFTSNSFGNLLQELLSKDGLSDFEKKNVELSWYDYNKSKKLPAAFVRELS